MNLRKKFLRAHELIGLEVNVVRSTCRHMNVNGKVVDETSNMLMIETRGGVKKIPKKTSLFAFKVDGDTVLIDGRDILYAPENRTKKAI
ncbi:MAG: ribonuclease P protein subunit [Candidatus Micrarchaeia archaeon]